MIYFNGAIVSPERAHVSLTDAGLLYGFGFFETFRTSGGRPHHWEFNHARLIGACDRANLLLPPKFLAHDEVRLVEIVRALLEHSQQNDAVFRYTVTAGTDGQATEFLTLRPLPASPPETGIALRVLKLRRDSGEWWPRPKSLNYANAFLGVRELQSRGSAVTDEGLFLSQRNEWVAETPRQNIAWIEGYRIRIPDPASGAVAGTCLAWLKASEVRLEPVAATLTELRRADAVFCLNSVRGITPVREIWDENDQQILQIFSSATHPVVTDLQTRWKDALFATANR